MQLESGLLGSLEGFAVDRLGPRMIIVTGAVLFGLFWGMRGPMMSSMRGQYFGRAAFGAITGTSSILTTACSMVGPLLVGYMADAQGNYVQGFLVLAVVSDLGSIFFLVTRRPTLPVYSSNHLLAG